MSVQSEFFDALLAELKARGLSDEVAEENVSKFKSQLKERAENDDYIDDALSKIPPASIAENIYNMLRAETDEDAGAKSEVMVIDTESDTVETTIKEGKDAMSPLSDTDDEQAAEAPDAAEETEAEQSEEAVDAVADEQVELFEAAGAVDRGIPEYAVHAFSLWQSPAQSRAVVYAIERSTSSRVSVKASRSASGILRGGRRRSVFP